MNRHTIKVKAQRDILMSIQIHDYDQMKNLYDVMSFYFRNIEHAKPKFLQSLRQELHDRLSCVNIID